MKLKLTVCKVLLAIALLAATQAAAAAGVMRIYAIDVGQGDSALVIFPDGSNMLIDAGTKTGGGYVGDLLQRLGIAHLDRVVMTHDDNDHIGGFTTLENDGYVNTSTQRFDWTNTTTGQYFYNSGGASVLCVTSNGHIIGGEYIPPGDDNDRCVGAIVKYRGFDYLTCGDIEWGGSYNNMEDPLGDALHARGDHIDIYKVHHHGSRYGSSGYFLQKMMPEFAVIMVGNNSFGHPTQEAIDRINAVGVQRIFQTEAGDGGTASNVAVANGQVVITTDGATYSFANEGPGSTPFYFGPYAVDEYVPPAAPHLLISEAGIGKTPPEGERWIELYLPPGASSVNLGNLFWVSRDKRGQLAKNGTLTMIPGDVAIVHMTASTDARTDESNATGKGANGWWDLYTRVDGNYWYSTEDFCMISRENSASPNPVNIIDTVVWSNHDGATAPTVVTRMNYPITISHWGDPTAGSGAFTSTNDSVGVGSVTDGYPQRLTTLDTDSKPDWRFSLNPSEGTPPPTPTPLPTPPPTPTPLPAVEVHLNSYYYDPGDSLIIDVVARPVTGRPFDAYLAITGPAGTYSVQPGGTLVPGIVPLARNVKALRQTYSATLLDMAVPTGVTGDYQAIAGLVDAGQTVKGTSSAFAMGVGYFSVR